MFCTLSGHIAPVLYLTPLIVSYRLTFYNERILRRNYKKELHNRSVLYHSAELCEINPLSAKPTKWSNHFVGLALKVLRKCAR